MNTIARTSSNGAAICKGSDQYGYQHLFKLFERPSLAWALILNCLNAGELTILIILPGWARVGTLEGGLEMYRSGGPRLEV